MQPTPYQSNCVKALWKWFETRTDNPLCVLATALGKSVIIAEFMKQAIARFPSTRIICAIDTKELVEQNYKKLHDLWTFAPAGVYSAGLKRRNTDNQILFCGIQSVYNKAEKLGACDLLIVDETHMLSLKNDSMWQQFIDAMLLLNPYMKIIGFTATPYRNDTGLIYTGDNAIFGGVAYEYGIKEGIRDGYLTEIIPKRMDTRLNVDGVGRRGGDFIESQLQEAVDKEEANKAIVSEIIAAGKYRKSWLVFGSGKEHCLHLVDEMKVQGITCEAVLGDTLAHLRDQYIADFKSGTIKCLVTNMVLTKGFDANKIDLIASARPTQSAVLWMQKVGRGLRLGDPSVFGLKTPEERRAAIAASNKPNCLLLDFAENIQRFGFIDEMNFRDKKKRDGDGVPPMKECPECQTILHASIMMCGCGYEFPRTEKEINTKAYDGAVLSTQNLPETKNVLSVAYSRHKKQGSDKAVLKVEYSCGIMEKYYEWVCFEHDGFARNKAVKWWRESIDESKINTMELAEIYSTCIPSDIETVLKFQSCFTAPAAIQVRKEGKFWQVAGKSQEKLGQEQPSLFEQLPHPHNQSESISADEIAF